MRQNVCIHIYAGFIYYIRYIDNSGIQPHDSGIQPQKETGYINMIITIKDRQTLYPIYSGYVSLEYLKILQNDNGFIIEINGGM